MHDLPCTTAPTPWHPPPAIPSARAITRELPGRFGITPHATRRIANRQIALGGTLALCSAVCVVASAGGSESAFALGVSVPFRVCGALVLAIGIRTRSVGVAVQVVNKAFNLASAGQREAASELLDYAEATRRTGYVLRIVDVPRALNAMQRGDLEGALRRASAAAEARAERLAAQLRALGIDPDESGPWRLQHAWAVSTACT